MSWSTKSWSTQDIPDLHGKVAVVTGANGGLGLASAKALAGSGELDLSGVRLLSDAHYLWSPGTLTGNLTSFFASNITFG